MENIVYNGFCKVEEVLYTVKISSRSTKRNLISFETEAEAIQFCENNNWEWIDENEFAWDMEIEEN